MKVYASCVNPLAKRGNLGDMFGYHYVEHHLGQSVLRLGVNDRKQIDSNTIAITGSILDSIYNTNIITYGTGFIRKPAKTIQPRAKILGVRGHLSANHINYPTKVVSDPGLLLSDLFDLKVVEDKKELGFIIHSVDRKKFFGDHPEWEPLLVNNYDYPEKFIEQLSQYKRIISSSLHGVIFSHSYGIPVAPIKITGKVIGEGFKFLDYYSSLDKSVKLAEYDGSTSYKQYIDYVDGYINPSFSKVNKIKEIQRKDLSGVINNGGRDL